MHKHFKELNHVYQDIKHFLKVCKGGKSKIKSIGKNCHEKDLEDPVECYLLVEGPIKYSQPERKHWEKKMKERAEKKGIVFKSTDYLLTDQIGYE